MNRSDTHIPRVLSSSIKSAFEPITPPLKWVLADAACKVSMIFFNIASGLCWEMPNGVKFLIFLRVFGFSRLRVKSCRCFLIYSFNRWGSLWAFSYGRWRVFCTSWRFHRDRIMHIDTGQKNHLRPEISKL